MSKEILRDKNGRFAKKSQEGIGISEEEYIQSLVNGKAELLRRNTELAYELTKIRAKLAFVEKERDDARQEVDRRNMRVHILTNDITVLMKENALLMKMYSVFIDYSSWWKRRERKAKIQELAGKLKEVHRECPETSIEHLMEIILK